MALSQKTLQNQRMWKKILCLGVLYAAVSTQAAEIEFFKEDASLKRVKTRMPAKIGLPVQVGDWLRTGDKSVLVIKIDEESKLKLNPNTIIRFIGKSTVRLRKGGLFSKVKKRKFRVRAGSATMGVRGTQFFTSLGGPKGKDVWMCVNEGEVTVQTKGSKKTTPVLKGQGVLVKKGKEVMPPKEYEWTKTLNWKMDSKEGELISDINLDSAYGDLLDQDYD